MTALSCSNLHAGYGRVSVVRGVDLTVEPGEIVALLGPNGAGKTTLVLTLAGLLHPITGTIRSDFVPSGRHGGHGIHGVVLVPDDRALFSGLTTRENLLLACPKGSRDLSEVLALFPQLEARLAVRAGLLSGGEQQMLAIGRALLQKPRILLIDELSMGLAPVIVARLLELVSQIAVEQGVGVVLVEQHVRLALSIAHRAVVLMHGEKVLEADAAELRGDLGRLERLYLGQTTDEG